jgi:hypothetical protein
MEKGNRRAMKIRSGFSQACADCRANGALQAISKSKSAIGTTAGAL